DFADVRAVMADAGSALMGIGVGSGKSRAREAAIAATSSPLLETSINGAGGVVFNITGGSDLTLHEVNQAAEIIYEAVDPNANIIFGAVIDDRLQGEIRITVIATGFSMESRSIPSITDTSSNVTPMTRTAGSAVFDSPVGTPDSAENTPEEDASNQPLISPNLDIPEFLQRRRNR
ncbi:MAG: cell division protein FtsZ, partial [Cyanobacteria bacterium J06648_10]